MERGGIGLISQADLLSGLTPRDCALYVGDEALARMLAERLGSGDDSAASELLGLVLSEYAGLLTTVWATTSTRGRSTVLDSSSGTMAKSLTSASGRRETSLASPATWTQCACTSR